MDQVILAEKLEPLRRCVQHLKDKRVSSAAELRDDIDRQDIHSLNPTRALQRCVDMDAHFLSATEEPLNAKDKTYRARFWLGSARRRDTR